MSVARLMGLKPEAWAMATVAHPAVAQIHGIESWRGRPFLVVEYLAGGTLADRLRRGRLPPRQAVSVAEVLADALGALHETGYLHGDVKPSNVGLTADGSPKLLDFGLARGAHDAGARGGTLRCLSPEVLSGRPAGEADDVWALCVLLYEMASGEHPFAGGGAGVDEVADRIRRQRIGRPARPPAGPASPSAGVIAFAASMLTAPRSARPATARAFGEALPTTRAAARHRAVDIAAGVWKCQTSVSPTTRRRMTGPAPTWRVLNIEMRLDEPESVLRDRAASAAGIDPERVRGMRIARRSVDARRRGRTRRLRFIVHADLVLDTTDLGPLFASAVRSGRVVEAPAVGSFQVAALDAERRRVRVVVVGGGPAGLYAALVLGTNGVEVDLVDRGAALKQRGADVVRFHRTRVPNPESNVLFGEGGAGTYSDGKLYTRVDDPLEVPCLEELVACGATPDILYDARAHIGTDRLHRILPVLRGRMESLGVRFHWNTRLDGLVLESGPSRRVSAVRTSAGELPCDAVFLALGHSARDSVRRLHGQGVRVAAKPFQLGVRIEHPQPLIDRGRYGDGPDAAALGPAYYNLVCKAGDGVPSSYSFCMCPGGTIVASTNAPGLLCTNGMSNSRHSSPWASAALVTTFGPQEYGSGPFAGVEFQETLERRFFAAGGGDYTAPAQGADDFLAERSTARPRRSTYTFGTCAGRIDTLLPPVARDAIARALREYERRIPGFSSAAGLLVGLESRSSGPIRLPRDRDTFLADDFDNLYPVGEGAGYAGGITSAAIDGARAALRYLRR